MKNKNCLAGMRCPECKSYGSFDIITTCIATVTDDGVSDTRDHEWDDDAVCYCCACDWSGTILAAKKRPTKKA